MKPILTEAGAIEQLTFDRIPEVESVAVVVVTWHSAAMTNELLLYLREDIPSVRAIVVDCGHAASGGISNTPGATWLSAGNLGYAGGNNLGIRYALQTDAKWVLILNSDAFPLEGAIGRLVRALKERPEAGAAGVRLLSKPIGKEIEVNSGTAFDWTSGRTATLEDVTDTGPVDFSCGAMVLFRSDALRRVGGFDSRLFLFYEELDWAERARAAGYEVLSVPTARAVHLGSVSVNQVPMASTFYRSRNRLIILRRYGARHGAPVRLFDELRRLLRAGGGHFVHGRWRCLWPLLSGTLVGLLCSLDWTDDPYAALAEQRWETRSAVSDSDCPQSLRSRWRFWITARR